MPNVTCPNCEEELDADHSECVRCGEQLRSNVLLAARPDEREALDERYATALEDAESHGCADVFRRFEAIVSTSKAVFACKYAKLEPIVSGDREIYTTYHQMRKLRLWEPRVLDGPDWNVVRVVAETALFGDESKRRIHYAALSLQDEGLPNYGECSIVLREDYIQNRASVFEENSLVFMNRHGIKVFETDRLPKGYRASWPERGRLAAAKLAARLDSSAVESDFHGILLAPHPDRSDDDFVEVHIYGSTSFGTFEKLTFRRSNRRPSKAKLKALRDRLVKPGVTFEEKT